MSFFSEPTSPDPAKTGRIKEWVMRCTEPGCPPLETVVAILDGPGNRRQAKLHLPVAEITEQEVARLSFS